MSHPDPPRCPHWASKVGGRSRHRPHGPVRHRRPGDNDATDFIPVTCGICHVSHPKADSVSHRPRCQIHTARTAPGRPDSRQNTLRASRLVRQVLTRCNSPRPDSRRARSWSSTSRTSPPRISPHASRSRLSSPLRMTSLIHSISPVDLRIVLGRVRVSRPVAEHGVRTARLLPRPPRNGHDLDLASANPDSIPHSSRCAAPQARSEDPDSWPGSTYTKTACLGAQCERQPEVDSGAGCCRPCLR